MRHLVLRIKLVLNQIIVRTHPQIQKPNLCKKNRINKKLRLKIHQIKKTNRKSKRFKNKTTIYRLKIKLRPKFKIQKMINQTLNKKCKNLQSNKKKRNKMNKSKTKISKNKKIIPRIKKTFKLKSLTCLKNQLNLPSLRQKITSLKNNMNLKSNS